MLHKEITCVCVCVHATHSHTAFAHTGLSSPVCAEGVHSSLRRHVRRSTSPFKVRRRMSTSSSTHSPVSVSSYLSVSESRKSSPAFSKISPSLTFLSPFHPIKTFQNLSHVNSAKQLFYLFSACSTPSPHES